MKNQWKKNYINFLCILITLPFGYLFGILTTNWACLNHKFFEVSYIQVVQAVITIVIAVFITQYVSERLNNSKNIKEIVLGLFDDFKDLVRNDFKIVENYMEKPSTDLEKQILNFFTRANFELTDIQEITSHQIVVANFYLDKSIEEDLLNLKKLVTEPFGIKKPSYSDKVKREIHSAYHCLLRKINLARFKTFE